MRERAEAELASAGPLYPEVGVIALVVEPWSDRWQVREHVLSRLSRYFRVVWVDPAHEWRDAWTRWRSGKPEFASPLPDRSALVVYTAGASLPKLYWPARAAKWLRARRLARARAHLKARGCRRVVLYLWRPTESDALDILPHDLSVYHIDDEYSFSDHERPLDALERHVLERVDQVFVHSPMLFRRKGAFNPRTMLVPNGVDFNAYAAAHEQPCDLASIPHPRVGYTGYIKRQVDWALLDTLARNHPEWSFVFVGRRRPHPEIARHLERLEARPNVHFLGAKTVTELIPYPQHFDVCIMPYVDTDYTRCIYPLKLHEYLASGQPVVGTALPSLEPLAGLVTLVEAGDEAGWSRALTAALDPGRATREHREARQAAAQQHDWNALVERIAAAMLDQLAPRRRSFHS